MNWDDIIDGESGAQVRAKINDAFNELFDSTPVNFWEQVAGTTDVIIQDERKVIVYDFEAGEVKTETFKAGSEEQVQIINNKLRLMYAGGFQGDTLPLVVDNEGFVGVDEEAEGDAPVGRGVMFTQYGYGESVSFDPLRPTILVKKDENFDIQMPSANSQNNAEAIIRKVSDNAYAATINTIAGEVYWDEEIGNGLTTTESGAWVKLKAVRVTEIIQYWVVVEMGGTWTLIS